MIDYYPVLLAYACFTCLITIKVCDIIIFKFVMIKRLLMFYILMITLFIMPFSCLSSNVNSSSDELKDWKKPIPIFKQKYDWLGLTSDEWLKGEILAMYDEELEFDSDEMGIQIIKMEDISELRAKDRKSVRLEDGRVIEGRLVIRNGVLTMKNTVETVTVPVIELLSIASSSDDEWGLWNGEVKLGVNLRGGNTEQLDYNFQTEFQRRTSTSRFHTFLLLTFLVVKTLIPVKMKTLPIVSALVVIMIGFSHKKCSFELLNLNTSVMNFKI